MEEITRSAIKKNVWRMAMLMHPKYSHAKCEKHSNILRSEESAHKREVLNGECVYSGPRCQDSSSNA